MRVAILDDETAELQRLEQTLQSMDESQRAPWLTHCFCRGEEMLRRLKRERYDLLILDWQVPDISGLQILKWSREHLEDSPPVIMITSRDSEQDVVRALNAGADDYICKPFRPHELRARILAVMRRRGGVRPAEAECSQFGDLLFDDAELCVSRAGQPVTLTEREYRIARYLFNNLGRPLSREYFYERFWPHEEVHSSRPLDTHIYRLRNKLGLSPEHGWQLLTIYGYGYRLERVGDEQAH